MSVKLAAFILLFFSVSNIQSQEKKTQETQDIKFGKVELKDFDLSTYNFDKEASAVIISDVGFSKFEGNTSGWFTLNHSRKMRIKILKKDGVSAATLSIPLYLATTYNESDKVEYIKAHTYNIEDGKVVDTKLSADGIFVEKQSKRYNVSKFTLPAVKEGSIIEVSYAVNTGYFFFLKPWAFQSTKYPTIWSEYNVEMPDFFNYVFLTQGFLNYDFKDKKTFTKSFNITRNNGATASSNFNITSTITDLKWVIKNAPALKEEPFTYNIDNQISKIEFQLSQYRFPEQVVEDVMPNWIKVSEKRMQDEQFGLQLDKPNNFLDDLMKDILKSETDKYKMAQKIYAFVRDNFTCTNHNATYMQEGSGLRTILKNKSGNVAEINLLLTAMLKHAKIEAYPVMLSTRENGKPHEIYPLLDRYNYIISEFFIKDTAYLLDASYSTLGFTKLPSKCYNGQAREISKTAVPLYLHSDSIMQKNLILATLICNEKKEVDGSITFTNSEFDSYRLRNRISKIGKIDFFNNLYNQFPTDVVCSNGVIDSLTIFEEPLQYSFDFKYPVFTEEIVYFNPMLTEQIKENPFKALERKYPVERESGFKDVYSFNMDIPLGYEIDELPKSTKVKYGDGEGYFEYMIAKNAESIQLRSVILFSKASFLPDEYAMLREFYSYIVKKHAEQIVFKKKK